MPFVRLDDRQKLIFKMAGKIFAPNASSTASRIVPIERAEEIMAELRRFADEVALNTTDFLLLGEVAATIFSAAISPRSNDAPDVKTVVGWTTELYKAVKARK